MALEPLADLLRAWDRAQLTQGKWTEGLSRTSHVNNSRQQPEGVEMLTSSC